MGNKTAKPAKTTKPDCAAAPEGRPTKYDPKFTKQAAKLCELGATDMELADAFGIDVATVYRWKHKHPEFCEAVICGKAAADDRVERSFYNRAVGYDHDAVKIFMPTGAAAPVYAPYREHVPPDTGAAFNWLKNRRSKEWRDVSRLEHEAVGDLAEALAAARQRAASING